MRTVRRSWRRLQVEVSVEGAFFLELHLPPLPCPLHPKPKIISPSLTALLNHTPTSALSLNSPSLFIKSADASKPAPKPTPDTNGYEWIDVGEVDKASSTDETASPVLVSLSLIIPLPPTFGSCLQTHSIYPCPRRVRRERSNLPFTSPNPASRTWRVRYKKLVASSSPTKR